MSILPPPEWVTRSDGVRLAMRRVGGRGPTIIFLPGYQSNMMGSKALALEAWAIRTGRAFVRFDYAGCGESEGAFVDQTLTQWRDDVTRLIELTVRGPVLLVGSSMGGWLMLGVALALGSQVVGMVGIAAAPDFTDWGFSNLEKAALQTHGRIDQANPYGPEPTITTRALWESGRAMRMLDGTIDLICPVRLLHGQADPDVPWDIALRLAAALRSDDVQTYLIKDGDHRLSRPQDMALLVATVDALLEIL
ncbi:MAG: alpha/beta hydrolase [Sphingomonadaceae bacterium]